MLSPDKQSRLFSLLSFLPHQPWCILLPSQVRAASVHQRRCSNTDPPEESGQGLNNFLPRKLLSLGKFADYSPITCVPKIMVKRAVLTAPKVSGYTFPLLALTFT